jgi:hypothetical protein
LPNSLWGNIDRTMRNNRLNEIKLR